MSPVYETDPVGGPEQGPYLNLVVELDTEPRRRAGSSSVCQAARGRGRTGARASAGGRARSTSTCSGWTAARSTSPTCRCPTRACGSGASCWPRSPTSPPTWSARGRVDRGRRARSALLGSLRRCRRDARPRSSGPAGPGRRWPGRSPTSGGRCSPSLGRGDDVGGAADGVDLVVIATPDAAVAEVAAAVAPGAEAVVAHLSGSLGLAPLAGHPRAAVRPPARGAARRRRGARRASHGAWFGLSADGDPLGAAEVVAALGGAGGHGRRGRLGPLPRGRGDRGQPPRRAARPGRARGGEHRCAARRLPRPGAGQPRRRGRPRPRRRAHRAGAPRRHGHRRAPPRGARPRRSGPPTRRSPPRRAALCP